MKELKTDKLDELYSRIMRDTQWAYADDGKPVNRLEAHPVFINSTIRAVNVSDSIIFFSEDDSERSLESILKAISKFTAHADIIPAGFGYRGCLIYGAFNYVLGSVKNKTNGIAYNVSAIYGKALIDAYKKAESQEWIGCFIDESVVEHVSNNIFSQNHFSTYVEYAVPFKNGKQKLLALKMTLSDSIGKSYEEQVKERFERNGLKFTEEVRLKYENTLEFRKYCNTLSE